MISPEMLPVHLRNIKKRLLGDSKSIKHDQMILDQAAEALTSSENGLIREWEQKLREVKRAKNKR